MSFRRLVAAALVATPLAAVVTAAGSTSARGRRLARVVTGSCSEATVTRASVHTGVRPDHSHLTPLLPRERELSPAAMSRDGKTIAYREGIYVSRADGSGLRRLVRDDGGGVALSPDGRLLAFSRHGIWIVGTDGRGLRRVTAGRYDDVADWSPDGKALVFLGTGPVNTSVVLRPLHGRPRVLASDGSSPTWSPDGRWIAYVTGSGLWVIRPDGAGAPRVAGAAVYVVVTGRREARLRGCQRRSRRGRRRRRPAEAAQAVITRLAPVLPAVPPAERVLGGETVATRDPVAGLAADGSRVAVIAPPSPTDCEHIVVWTPSTRSIQRVSETCARGAQTMFGLELAGTRAAWTQEEDCGNACEIALRSATLADRRPVVLDFAGEPDEESDYYDLRADAGLLVFDNGSRLVRIGGGSDECGDPITGSPISICQTLRRGDHACCVDSVSRGLIAIRETDAVTVLDAQGALVRVFPFGRNEVKGARLDSGRLVVADTSILEVYDVATGAVQLQRPLPVDYRLIDVDGGIALLQREATIMLLRLADGRSLTLTPGKGPVFADLEPDGLYYSFATAGGGGRVVFVPRAELLLRLG